MHPINAYIVFNRLKLTIVELKQNITDCIRIHEHDKRKLIDCKKHNIMETKKISDKDNELIHFDYKVLSLKRVVEKLEVTHLLKIYLI